MKKIYLVVLIFSILALHSNLTAENTKKIDPFSMNIEQLMNIEVVTASKIPEKISTAPGVISVVTHEEIKNMGARTLMDVLQTVPGFNIIQDNNEHIVAMRGVYATTNQKILVLRNGHRLNEFLFENSEMDYSISMANVEKIEIIRGPGASLYGNAALMAVINIITRKPEDIDGTDVTISLGDYGQRSVDTVYGKKFSNNAELLLFATYSNTNGEDVGLDASEDYGDTPQTAGEMTVDQYPDNFDIGLSFKLGNFTLSASHRKSHYVQPKGNAGQTIDNFDLYKNLEQEFCYSSLSLQYEVKRDDLQIKFRHYLDYQKYHAWQMITTSNVNPPQGKLFALNYKGLRLGLNYEVIKYYNKGTFLAGVTVEQWELKDSFTRRNWADFSTWTKDSLIPEERAVNNAFYMQWQHDINQFTRISLGARYDYFEGIGGNISPRLALIFTLPADLTLKLMYSEAFLSPTYFYRVSNPALGYGSTSNLEPETIKSYQISLRYEPSPRSYAEITYFLNDLEGLISKDTSVNPNIYKNHENYVVQGIETELKFHIIENRLTARINATWQSPVASQTSNENMFHG
ncbi:MAG: TonB-dependent receptor, partial [Verrucomicrobiota bacterium]|nr:TonB-dependent receptor [Verrucomicrobiota bacterium]